MLDIAGRHQSNSFRFALTYDNLIQCLSALPNSFATSQVTTVQHFRLRCAIQMLLTKDYSLCADLSLKVIEGAREPHVLQHLGEFEIRLGRLGNVVFLAYVRRHRDLARLVVLHETLEAILQLQAE